MSANVAFLVGACAWHKIEDVVHLILSFTVLAHLVLRVCMAHYKRGAAVPAAASDCIV